MVYRSVIPCKPKAFGDVRLKTFHKIGYKTADQCYDEMSTNCFVINILYFFENPVASGCFFLNRKTFKKISVLQRSQDGLSYLTMRVNNAVFYIFSLRLVMFMRGKRRGVIYEIIWN